LFLSFLYKEQDVVNAIKKDFQLNKSIYHKLNQHITNDASIIHLANDYGQLDILLTLQQPKRKIQSFIENGDRRGVARTNYLVKKRTITYHNNIEELNFNASTLIIGEGFSKEIKFEQITNIQTILLLSNSQLEVVFKDLHFAIMHKEETFSVLKKQG
jgi:hypothetical protein